MPRINRFASNMRARADERRQDAYPDDLTKLHYMRVSVRLVAGARSPCAAITVIVAWVGGVTFAPQPVQRPAPSMAPASTSICKPRRLLQPKQQRESASAEPGNNALEPVREASCVGVVVIVSVDEAIEPEGVTVEGENVHDAHEGNPAQVKEASSANPFCGVTRTVVVPLAPAATASDAGETSTEKLGELANWPMVKLVEATALVE